MLKKSRIVSSSMNSLILVFFLTVFSHPAVSDDTAKKFWICHQVGLTFSKPSTLAIATTEVFNATMNTYGVKEGEFSMLVNIQTDGKFSPEFDPHCEEYDTQEKAKLWLKKRIYKYEKNGYRVFWINLKKELSKHNKKD